MFCSLLLLLNLGLECRNDLKAPRQGQAFQAGSLGKSSGIPGSEAQAGGTAGEFEPKQHVCEGQQVCQMAEGLEGLELGDENQGGAPVVVREACGAEYPAHPGSSEVLTFCVCVTADLSLI